jgi:diacylglycerol kinase (ATP)
VRVTLFHNPNAGDATLNAEQLETILSEAGYQVRYQSTAKDWRSALDAVGELAVVAGGDGTVAAVAKALADTGTPLAVLPFGTANNIGMALGVFGDVREVVAGWRGAPRSAMDVGVISGPFGEQRFIESVGGGVFAELVRRGRLEVDEASAIVHRETDRALQLLRAILAEAAPADWQLELDGYDLSGTYLGVEAMNIGFVGPNVPLAADAVIDDGELDLVLLREEDRERLLEYVVGRVESASALMPSLDVRRGRQVRLVPPAGWPIRIDDELVEIGGDDDAERDTRVIDILIRPRGVELVGRRTDVDRR